MSASLGFGGATGAGGVATHPAKPTIAAQMADSAKARQLLPSLSIEAPSGANDDQDRLAWEAKYIASRGIRDAQPCAMRPTGSTRLISACSPRACPTRCGSAGRAGPSAI